MSKTVDITVICLAYCHEQYAKAALDSVVNQKGNFSYEVLVSDDASTDNTPSIIREYEEKYPFVKAILRDENVGGCRNVQYLMSIARGRYIAILELDDYWTDEYKLQKQLDLMENNPDYVGCTHNFNVINSQGTIIKESTFLRNKCKNSPFTMRMFRNNGFVIHTSTIFFRNILCDYPESIWCSDRNRGDIFIFYILLMNSPLLVLKDSMSTYRKILDVTKKNVCSTNLKDPAGSRMRQVLQASKLISSLGGSLTLYSFLADSYLIWIRNENKAKLLGKLRSVFKVNHLLAVLLMPYRLFILSLRFIKIKSNKVRI